MRAPITLIVYTRLNHTWRTVDALFNNNGSSEHDLIVYSDAPGKVENIQAVAEVRSYLETIRGFRSVTIHHRPYKYGLAKSIAVAASECL
jgi:hypothetical protein